MGFFDSMFGGLFDLDGNGIITPDEDLVSFAFLEDLDNDDCEDDDFE